MALYSVRISRTAERQLKQLPTDGRTRIVPAPQGAANSPHTR